jgi:hypothetical protein
VKPAIAAPKESTRGPVADGRGTGSLRCFPPVPIATRKAMRIGIHANRSYLLVELSPWDYLGWRYDRTSHPPVENSISTEGNEERDQCHNDDANAFWGNLDEDDVPWRWKYRDTNVHDRLLFATLDNAWPPSIQFVTAKPIIPTKLKITGMITPYNLIMKKNIKSDRSVWMGRLLPVAVTSLYHLP